MHLVLGGGWNYNLRQVISVSVVANLAPAFVRLMRDEGMIDQRRPDPYKKHLNLSRLFPNIVGASAKDM